MCQKVFYPQKNPSVTSCHLLLPLPEGKYPEGGREFEKYLLSPLYKLIFLSPTPPARKEPSRIFYSEQLLPEFRYKRQFPPFYHHRVPYQ